MIWIDSSTLNGENSPTDIPKRDPNSPLKTHAKGHGERGRRGRTREKR